jgi:(p)ppGpp synthase/HD superfamily hydrolase
MILNDTLTFRAGVFAMIKHSGQMDDEGFDYFDSHLKQVYAIVLQVTDDEEVLAACYLHDTLEDTKTTYEELLSNFGKRVADLVMEVTHEGEKDSKGYFFPRLKSKEAILIKFADRMSNISRMRSWSKDRQDHYLKKIKFWKSE